MIRRLLGRLLFKVGGAAGKCLAAFLIHKTIKEKCKMLTVNNGNGQQVSFWGALGQIALAGFASWGITKIGNQKTSWVPYRDQMAASLANTAMTFLAQQAVNMPQPATAKNDGAVTEDIQATV
jgi:hypothetical protein